MRQIPIKMPLTSSVIAVIVVTACLCAGLLQAATPSDCAGAELELDAETAAAHPGLHSRLAPRLVGADPCARVRVVTAGGTLVVVVTLRDGRTALRKAADEEEVVDAVDALVTLPTAPVVTSGTTSSPPAPSSSSVTPPRHGRVATLPSTTERTRLEIGAAATMSLVGPPGFAEFGVLGLAQLHVTPYLFGIVVHFNPVGEPLDNNSMSARAMFGRRMHLAGLELDLLGGIGLWAMNIRGGLDEASPRRLHPRLVVSGRLSQDVDGPVRGYLAVDFAVGWPSGAGASVAFPSSSATLALGLAWRGQ